MVAGSGLAGILAHVDICEMKLKLFSQRLQVFGCSSDLAFGTKLYFRAGRALAFNRSRPGSLRDYERRLFHSSSFPQDQPMRYASILSTILLPKLERMFPQFVQELMRDSYRSEERRVGKECRIQGTMYSK